MKIRHGKLHAKELRVKEKIRHAKLHAKFPTISEEAPGILAAELQTQVFDKVVDEAPTGSASFIQIKN